MEGEYMKKKILISTLAVLLLITGCRNTPKLQNGEEKVISFTEGGISVEELYDKMKSQYALNILLDMIDTKILNEKYESTDEEKENIELQKQNDQTYYSLLYSGTYQTYQSYLKARYNIETESELEEIFKLIEIDDALDNLYNEEETDNEADTELLYNENLQNTEVLDLGSLNS